MRLYVHMATSRPGHFVEFIVALASCGSCALFVWESYVPLPTADDYTAAAAAGVQTLPEKLFSTEVAFSTLFTYAFFIGLYADPKKLKYMYSMQSVVDMITVTPVLISLFGRLYSLDQGFGFLRFTRVMKFARVLRLLRIMKVGALLQSATDSAIRRASISLLGAIMSLVVVGTGLVQFLANEVPSETWGAHAGKMEFHDAFYFLMVTITTVGYGDIAPEGVIGRFLMLSIIALFLVLIPMKTTTLQRLLRMRSDYAGSFPFVRNASHIILQSNGTGNNAAPVQDFLREFFHPDHGKQTTNVCIVAPCEPSVEMCEVLLRYGANHNRVRYLRGDVLNLQDLLRCRPENAEGMFILADRHTRAEDEQDSITVLRALTTKRAFPDLPCFVQTIEPENVSHTVNAGVDPNHIICVDEVRLSLIGLSVHVPGLSTLVTNLICSSSWEASMLQAPWHRDYARGLAQEIYCVELPDAYTGMSFKAAACQIYDRHNALLFAISANKGRSTSATRAVGSGEHHGHKGHTPGEKGGPGASDDAVNYLLLNPCHMSSIPRGSVGFFIADDIKGLCAAMEHAPSGDRAGGLVERPALARRPSVVRRRWQAIKKHRALTGTGGGERGWSSFRGGGAGGGGGGKPPLLTENSARRHKRKITSSLSLLSETRTHGNRSQVVACLARMRSQPGRGKWGNTKWGDPIAAAMMMRELNAAKLAEAHAALVGRLASATAELYGGDTSAMLGDLGVVANTLVRWNAAAALARGPPAARRATLRAAAGTKIEFGFAGGASLRGGAGGGTAGGAAGGSGEDDGIGDLDKLLEDVGGGPGGEGAGGDSRRRGSKSGAKQKGGGGGKWNGISAFVLSATERAPPEVAAAMRDHCIVLCDNLDDLHFFVRNVHTPRLQSLVHGPRTLVVLCPEAPEAHHLNWSNVVFVSGTSHIRDLLRCHVHAAFCVVILEHKQSAFEHHVSADDAASICAALDIRANVTAPVRVIVELSGVSFMKHLGSSDGGDHGGGPQGRRLGRRMSGGFFAPKQAGHHPRRNSVMAASAPVSMGRSKKEVRKNLRKRAKKLVNQDVSMFEESYAAGNCIIDNFLESLVCQAFFNPGIVAVLRSLLSPEPAGNVYEVFTGKKKSAAAAKAAAAASKRSQLALEKHLGGSREQQNKEWLSGRVELWEMPSGLAGKSYSELLANLLYDRNAMPLGLYRRHSQGGSGRGNSYRRQGSGRGSSFKLRSGLENAMPAENKMFVFTNPPADTVLRADDFIYVIAHEGSSARHRSESLTGGERTRMPVSKKRSPD